MIFQHTHEKVLDGLKTQTRRLIKPGEWIDVSDPPNPRVVQMGKDGKLRTKWQVGKTYAVQPGRTKKAIGRIRITGIRRERLQDITEEDALAEGCEGLWNPMRGYYNFREAPTDTTLFGKYSKDHFKQLWDSIHTKPGTRWDDNPEVWVLEFEVIS
jgi:hypothetical protein